MLLSELTDFACEITKRTVIVIEKHSFAWYNIILDSPRRKQSNHQLAEKKKIRKKKKTQKKVNIGYLKFERVNRIGKREK